MFPNRTTKVCSASFAQKVEAKDHLVITDAFTTLLSTLIETRQKTRYVGEEEQAKFLDLN